jgi:cation:H+ antiporter
MAYVLLVVGLITLILGGEVLVKGAVNLAFRYRVSTLVVGMTVVSFGTSMPELLVSVKAALSGHPDISIGNVVGSNIANLALVLGLTAMIWPIAVDRNSIRFDWPMMMFSTVLLYIFMLDYNLVWYEGAILFTILIAFTVFLIWKSRKDTKSKEEDEDHGVSGSIYKDLMFILFGCVGLAMGAEWLVDGAVEVARGFGVSDLVISVTIVAFGTSAPELITSLLAAFRQQSDISVGNLIGSNVFNINAILGITSMITSVPINKDVMNFDIYWVGGISLIVFPFILTSRKVSRVEGAVLFSLYLAYIITLFIYQS